MEHDKSEERASIKKQNNNVLLNSMIKVMGIWTAVTIICFIFRLSRYLYILDPSVSLDVTGLYFPPEIRWQAFCEKFSGVFFQSLEFWIVSLAVAIFIMFINFKNKAGNVQK